MTKIYEKAYTYAIRSHQTDNIYIGSTSEFICKRMQHHKYKYKIFLKTNLLYVTSYEILKYDDAYIEIIEEYENITRDTLRKYEGNLIRNIPCVNKFIPTRTAREYRADNREKYQLYEKTPNCRKTRKEYRDKNIEKINETLECLCGVKHSYRNKGKHVKSKKHQEFLKSILLL